MMGGTGMAESSVLGPLSRREFLKTSLVVGGAVALPSWLLAACGSGSSGAGGGNLTLVRYQLDWIKNSEFAGFYIADAEGYYKQEGLTVKLLPGADVASHEAVVAGGGAEIGTSSFLSRIVDAVNSGSDLVVVGAGFQQSPIGLMSMAKNPIRTAKDMVGKRIGLQEGSTSEIKLILKLNGLDPNNWKEVLVGFDPSPLLHGQVDAYYAYLTNQPLIFESMGLKEGKDFVVVSFQDLGWYQYGFLAITKRAYLEQHRDHVVGFMRATIKGWERAIQDPQLGIRLTMQKYGKNLGLKEPTEVASLNAQLPLMQSPLTNKKGLYWMDLDLLAGQMYEALRKGGRSKLPAPDKLVDLSVLRDVYGGKTKLLGG
jgi:ABC-type nitrate/sulfonate/bicarbonate transport system substrate-binding protein